MFLQGGHDFAIVVFPVFALGRNYEGAESEAAGDFKGTGGAEK